MGLDQDAPDTHAILLVEPDQQPDFYFEYAIETLFCATSKSVRRAPLDELQAIENPIVVYFGFAARPSTGLLEALDRLPGHSLLHLSDERLQHDAGHYRNARAVLRCYYDPRLRMDNVFAVPPGFQTGFLNHSKVDLDAKDLAWCFAGQVKSNRRRMLAAFARVTPNHAHLTGQWNDPKGLGVEDMRRLYARSIFAPCPVGYRNPDCFRVMECLEQGVIPVVLSFLGEDYFRYVYGDHPFIVASTWAKAAAQAESLLADPPALRQRQQDLVAWYQKFKRDLALDVRDILDGARHEDLRSPQFRLQKQGMPQNIVRRYDFYFGHGLLRRIFRAIAYSRT